MSVNCCVLLGEGTCRLFNIYSVQLLIQKPQQCIKFRKLQATGIKIDYGLRGSKKEWKSMVGNTSVIIDHDRLGSQNLFPWKQCDWVLTSNPGHPMFFQCCTVKDFCMQCSQTWVNLSTKLIDAQGKNCRSWRNRWKFSPGGNFQLYGLQLASMFLASIAIYMTN